MSKNPRQDSLESDAALVRQAQQGSAQAFNTLFVRHRQRIFAAAFSIVKNAELAEELAQEAWTKSLQALDQYDGRASFTAWLARISINLSLDHLRQQKRRRSKAEELLSVALREDQEHLRSASQPLEQADLHHQVHAAILKLSKEHRAVIFFHEIKGLSCRDTAETLDCPEEIGRAHV